MSASEVPGAAFLDALAKLPRGYHGGQYAGRRYGTTVTESSDGRRIKLFANELGGNDIVSFNLYIVSDMPRLKPCEMSIAKVENFVTNFVPDCN